MILLEPGNRILLETILAQFQGPEVQEVDDDEKKGAPKKEAKRPPVDIRLCDFDDASYRVTIDKDDRSTLLVSLNLPAWRQTKDHGSEAALKATYGDLVRANPVQEMDVTLGINLDTLPEDNKDALAKKLSLLKSVVIGGVFKQFYTNLKEGKPSEPFKFDLRRDTTVFFVSDKDRCTTIFALDFYEKVDKVLAKVFMSEFVSARGRMGFAPTVAFNAVPPAELKAFGITEPPAGGTLGYISFGVLQSHVKDAALIDKITSVLQSFRNYIQYHIKCSKSYFHSRMRARCVNLLKVLNRAKIEDPEKDKTKGKKTINGRTFRRA